MASRKRWSKLSQRQKAAVSTRACQRCLGEGTTVEITLASYGEIPKRIMVFGDSNAFRPDGGDSSWPGLLESKDPVRLEVINESCDGRTTRYDVGEYNGLAVIQKKLALHTPLDYIIIMLGTNDVKSKYGPPSAAEITDGIHQILDLIDAQSSGARPVLMTPPPLGRVTSGELAGAQVRIRSLAAEYRLLAMNRNIRLIDIYAVIDNGTELETDKIHLSVVGRQRVAETVWTDLQHLL